jgi:hypothetical protein
MSEPPCSSGRVQKLDELKSQMFTTPTHTVCLMLLICLAVLAVGQTPTSPPAGATGVIRLRVRVGIDDGSKAEGLARKRFFLIKGSLDQNKDLMQAIEQHPVVSRDCYYRSIGASEALIAWLKENRCESVYCREVEQRDVAAVPEFQHAVAVGEKEYGSHEFARKWLAVKLPENIRNGFYKRHQQDLQALLAQAEQQSQAKVLSVMTDNNGTAYFTDVEPGVYVISNIIPTEVASATELWRCPVTVAPGDLATETQYLISNPGNKDPRDKRSKCMSVARPLPACPLNPIGSK